MIRILNQDFQILETVTRYTSVEFTRELCDYGSFTAQIPISAAPKHLDKNLILSHKGSYGIIRYISQSNGYITVQGHDLKALLNQRCIFEARSGSSESVIKDYIAEAQSGEGRAFPNFEVAADEERGAYISYSFDGFILLDTAIRDICTKNGWGYDVTVADKRAVFDVYVPKTVDVIYSKRYRNLKDYEYIFDALEERNAALNCAEWTGLDVEYDSDQTKAIVKAGRGYFSDGSDFEITEDTAVSTYVTSSSDRTTYVYAQKNISSGTVSVTSAKKQQYNTSTYKYALLATLASGNGHVTLSDRYSTMTFCESGASGIERRETPTAFSGSYEEISEACLDKIAGTVAESVEAEILSSDDYGTKWNLGDFVTLRVEALGGELTVEKQITRVREVYEPNSRTVTPTFGPIRATVFKRLARGRM